MDRPSTPLTIRSLRLSHELLQNLGLTLNALAKVSAINPDWLVALDDHHWGFSRFTANATTLVFEYVRDDDGQVHDTVVFTK
eukprot:Em0012g641a